MEIIPIEKMTKRRSLQVFVFDVTSTIGARASWLKLEDNQNRSATIFYRVGNRWCGGEFYDLESKSDLPLQPPSLLL